MLSWSRQISNVWSAYAEELSAGEIVEMDASNGGNSGMPMFCREIPKHSQMTQLNGVVALLESLSFNAGNILVPDVFGYRLYWINRSALTRHFMVLASILQMCLGIYERPTLQNNHIKPGLSDGVIVTLECFILLCYGVHMWAEVRIKGRHAMACTWFKLRSICFALMVLNSAVAIPLVAGGWRVRLFTVVLRPVMLLTSLENVRGIVVAMCRCVPKLFYIGVMQATHLVISAAAARVLFKGLSLPGPDVPLGNCQAKGTNLIYNASLVNVQFCSSFSQNCTDYFRTFWSSMQHLFTLLTTANFPDIQLPAYDCYWWAPLFFIVFTFVGIYFLLGLILAVAYNQYQSSTQAVFQRRRLRRETGLVRAFLLLSVPVLPPWYTGEEGAETGGATEEEGKGKEAADWEAALAVAQQHKYLHVFTLGLVLDVIRYDLPSDFRRLLAEEAAQRSSVYQLPDGEEAGVEQLFPSEADEWRKNWIDLGAFVSMSPLLDMQVRLRKGPRSVRRGLALRLLDLPAWDRTWDLLLCLSSALLIWAVVESDYGNFTLVASLLSLSDAFLVFFTLEMLAQLLLRGPHDYAARSLFNCLDLCILPASFALFLFPLSGNHYLYRGLQLLRLVRCLRALRCVRQFDLIILAIQRVVPVLMRYVGALGCVYYVFAAVGMELFAGTLVDGSGVRLPAVESSSFGHAGYWKVNFDSLYGSFVTLHALTIVNNWVEVMEGYVAVLGQPVRLYFFSFYLVTVLVVANVVAAFLIEAFSGSLDALKKAQYFGDSLCRCGQQDCALCAEQQTEFENLHSGLKAPTLDSLLHGVEKENAAAGLGVQKLSKRASMRSISLELSPLGSREEGKSGHVESYRPTPLDSLYRQRLEQGLQSQDVIPSSRPMNAQDEVAMKEAAGRMELDISRYQMHGRKHVMADFYHF